MSSSDVTTDQPKEAIVQYDEPHPAGRDRRGVLIRSLHDEPAISWDELSYSLASIRGAVNPNTVRFRIPARINRAYWSMAQTELQAAFVLAFPDKPAPIVHLSAARGFKYVDIEAPAGVKLCDVVAAAEREGWTVGGEPLDAPQFLGLQTSKMVHVIRFDKIPHDDLHAFIDFLPELFQIIEPSVPTEIVDIWKLEYKVNVNSPQQTTSTWTFGNSLVVLFSLPNPLPGTGRIADIVDRWPGWYMWRDKCAIGLVFPGRYDYCSFCKYTAQMFEGHENRRHTTAMCRKLICMKCGKQGHYDTTCKAGAFQYRLMSRKAKK